MCQCTIKQSAKSVLVRIQVAAAYKYKAEENARKQLVFSLLMPLICTLEQSPGSWYHPKTASQRKKKAALHEYLTGENIYYAIKLEVHSNVQ